MSEPGNPARAYADVMAEEAAEAERRSATARKSAATRARNAQEAEVETADDEPDEESDPE